MADARLKKIVSAMVEDAGRRLLIDGVRGVVIALIHEDDELPLGTCVMQQGSTLRDIAIGVRRINAIQDSLVDNLLAILDRRVSVTREGDAGLEFAKDDGTVADGSSPPDNAEDASSLPAAEGAEGEPSRSAGGGVGLREDGDSQGDDQHPDESRG